MTTENASTASLPTLSWGDYAGARIALRSRGGMAYDDPKLDEPAHAAQ